MYVGRIQPENWYTKYRINVHVCNEYFQENDNDHQSYVYMQSDVLNVS